MRDKGQQLQTSLKTNFRGPGSNNIPKNALPICAKKSLKPARVQNYASGSMHTDILSKTGQPAGKCTTNACSGSHMSLAPRNYYGCRTKEDILTQAEDFMKQFFTDNKTLNSGAHQERWREVQRAIAQNGTYDLTYNELCFAAKTAWRNAPRCVGRIQWSKLQVFDARHAKTARDMFEAICSYLEYATNNGNIRSAITVFPHRVDGRHDFRVWNSQILKFAGYQKPDGSVIGDPGSVEFTELCMKMGWRGKGTQFDVLPLVLQANGQDPELFELPPELVLLVDLKHPSYDWFESLGLKWYGVPAVANMCLDAGGLEFTGAPFSGWYMGTEIGARDLCDSQRYNLLHTFGEKMGLDTSRNSSLWRDKVLVEVNLAVLYSFESARVTIYDHHTASETFMKFFNDEFRLRGGCPADWVWVVPPMSASVCPVFHQEMYNYVLKPSYEYQDDPSKTYIWRKDREAMEKGELVLKKITFREAAWAVLFAVSSMRHSMAKRRKCTIIYATETQKSETFAKKLNNVFTRAFNSKVLCVSDYNVNDLHEESLLFVVTSTFGNGDPPDNGRRFANGLAKMVKVKDNNNNFNNNNVISNNNNSNNRHMFGVFALGSRAYLNFCEFGRLIDRQLAELGGQRIIECGIGDEMRGQEKAFNTWAGSVFKAACDSFNISASDSGMDLATSSLLEDDMTWSPGRFRLTPVTSKISSSLTTRLSIIHKQDVHECVLTSRKALQAPESELETILLTLDCQNNSKLQSYSPGDHLALFPANRRDLVHDVISRLQDTPPLDQKVQLEIMKVNDSVKGTGTWDADKRFPVCSLREMFTRYLDIMSAPTPSLLQQLASLAVEDDKWALEQLANDTQHYEDWKATHSPCLSDVLKAFPSLRVPSTLLITQLPLLQRRFYSISSSPVAVPGKIQATVGVIKYKTKGNPSVIRHGVCSSWLNAMSIGENVCCYIRAAETFHLPEDRTKPVIMIGPGTGIAPLRGFWQQRRVEMETRATPSNGYQSGWGPMTLYFGCRQSQIDNLYSEETRLAQRDGVLANVHTAFSREPNQPKTYVQDLLWENGEHVFDHLVRKQGHLYICGDSTMASDVRAKLETIFCYCGNMTKDDARDYVTQMRETNRYHEDIFGQSYRLPQTAEPSPKEKEPKHQEKKKPLYKFNGEQRQPEPNESQPISGVVKNLVGFFSNSTGSSPAPFNAILRENSRF